MPPEPSRVFITRRSLLRQGAAAGAALTLPGLGGLTSPSWASAAKIRAADSLPDPRRPAGTPNLTMPFDHVVVVMMENHSFDNLLGGLALTGRSGIDGLTFTAQGAATNSNPDPSGTPVSSYAASSTAQPGDVTQTWDATHEQVDGGRMDGFVVQSGTSVPMSYFPEAVLPFAYSLASTFPVANRWFCSAPCQTYPNRRFLMAATAYGDIATSSASLQDAPPPNGTIFDRLQDYEISWRNYFTDLPQTAIIPSIIEKYPGNLAPIAQFYADCAAGTLPAVSFVDPEFGALSDIGSPIASLPGLSGVGGVVQSTGGDQESPQDMYYGEAWAHGVIQSVLASPAWPRTLLIYTYDEHGGYYDHVPPPPAIAPDSIAPELLPGDAAGSYAMYGPRVPAVVVSPWAKAGGVTNVVHDHTSALATIEAKWNLPFLTLRDANASTVMDFLDHRRAAFLSPPVIAGPSASGPSGPAT